MKEARRRPLSQTFTNFLLPKELRDEPRTSREEKARRRFSLFVKVDEDDSETDSSLTSPFTDHSINGSSSSIDEVDDEPMMKTRMMKPLPPLMKPLPPLEKPASPVVLSPRELNRLSVTSRTSLSNIMEFFSQINYGDLEMRNEMETEEEVIKMFNSPGDYNVSMIGSVMMMGYDMEDAMGLDDVELVFGASYHEVVDVE